MSSNITISEELKSTSLVLAELDRVNVYTVPDGYFEGFAQSVISTLRPEIKNINETMFPKPEVPAGYFESLSGKILQKIKATESKEKLYVDSLSKQNPFIVPENYFETLPRHILQAIQNKKTKVISLPERSGFIRYAVAAMLTGALALGVYKYSENPNSNHPVTAAVTASLDSSIVKGKNMDEQQFSQTLNNLSEDDIAGYLEKNGDEKDLQMLASAIDEKNLPEQDDYITDANVLDKYFGE
jgi:hypothetical protein